LLAAPLVAEAQQAGTVYRIGYLSTGSPPNPYGPVFEEALRERGWVTGKNLVITYRYAEGKYDRLPALAAELVRLDPQVIMPAPTAPARAAKDATSTIPIVMWDVPDPRPERLPLRRCLRAHPHFGCSPSSNSEDCLAHDLVDQTRAGWPRSRCHSAVC
jgi:hypothetical protein